MLAGLAFLAAPFAQAQQQASPAPPPPAVPLALVSGIVTDTQNSPIAGAKVRLLPATGTAREQQTDNEGHYSFPSVEPGIYSLRATATGYAAGSLNGLTIAAGTKVLPPLALRPATQDSVDAISSHDLAEIQVHEEEQQRLFGAIPNYFVTYDWHAQPLDARQKLELAWKTTIDPVSIVINAGIAGVQQADNALAGYHQGAEGYGKRFGAAQADFAVGTAVGGAILPILLRQDPRYFYKGTGSVTSRALYALSTAVICRGDNGKWQVSYSGIGGDIAAGAISNVYYPKGSRNGVTVTVGNGLISAGLDGVGNLVQEFLLKHLTPDKSAVGH